MNKIFRFTVIRFLLATLLIAMNLFFPVAQVVIVSGGTDNDIAGRMCRTPDGDILAIIERNPDWGSGNFYVTRSQDEGQTWSILDPAVEQAGNQSTHFVVSDNDSVYLYYASDETGYYKIFCVQSADGITWENTKQLDLGWGAAQSVYDPIVIRESDGSYSMSYISMGYGTYAAHCPVGGTWDTDRNQIQSGAYRSRICRHTDGTYMAAYHRNISGNYDIHVKTSNDLITWSDEVDITSNGNSHDAFCCVSPDGIFFLYYAKNTGGIYNLCRKTSTDGFTWTSEEVITNDVTHNTQPSIFFDRNLLHLMWTHAIDYDTNNDVYYQHFDYITEGINKNPPEAYSVMVIPQDHSLFIQIQPTELTDLHETVRIRVVNMLGQIVYEEVINTFKTNHITVKTGSSGCFIVKVETPSYIKTFKTVIE